MKRMDVNPYESPAEASRPISKRDNGIVTDWFSLAALLIGTIAALVVGIAIQWQKGDRIVWVMLGATAAVGSITISGWVLGRFLRRMN